MTLIGIAVKLYVSTHKIAVTKNDDEIVILSNRPLSYLSAIALPTHLVTILVQVCKIDNPQINCVMISGKYKPI